VCVLLLAPAVGEAASPAPARRDTLKRVEGIPISHVEIVCHNIFDPVPSGKLSVLYQLANRLHVRTRTRTVRTQLLFEAGDPWSTAEVLETERNLRALDFLAVDPIDVTQTNDSAFVRVETWDSWSTNPQFSIQSADGKQYGSLAFTERNFLGLGKSFSIESRQTTAGNTRSLSFDDPSLFGTRARLHYYAGDANPGARDKFGVGVPFYAQTTPHAYGGSWVRETSLDHLFQSGKEVATIDRRIEQSEAHWGLGGRNDGRVKRWSLYFSDYERRLGPTTLVPGSNPPSEFQGGEENLRLRRFELEGRIWRPNFIERVNVNRMVLTEDFDVGTSYTARVGYAPMKIGSTADEGSARLQVDAGLETRYGFGWVRAAASARFREEPFDQVEQFDARWIRQGTRGHTMVLGAYGASGHLVGRDFQYTLGSLSGLRAYPVQALAGTSVLRFNFEDRHVFTERLFQVFAIGGAAFVDAARAWGAGSAHADWHSAAGLGFRMAAPNWSTSQVLRFDIAWPVYPERDGSRNPVISFGSGQAF
jgi:hypothetical protein